MKVSHAVLTGVAVAGVALVVQCVPYPNVGLPFGYWAYPNRALSAFLDCSNVHSATIGRVNHDLDLEEFEIVVEFGADRERSIQEVQFPQYPSTKQIAALVAEAGCEP